MELDSNQLRAYKPTPKKSKSTVEASSAAVEGVVAAPSKKSTSSGAVKRKKAASSSKRPALSEPAAAVVPSTAEEVEEEAFPEPLTRRKKAKMQETKPALLNTTPLDPHPFGSGDFPTFRTGVIPESENSQVPPEDSSTMAPEASFYDEVAREALKAGEEIFREEDTSTTTIPLADLMEDPPLSV